MLLKTLFAVAIILASLSANGNTDFPFSTSLAKSIITPKVYTINGVVEAVKKATLSAQVSGRVIAVNFNVGDFVNENDVLVRIRNTEVKAQLISVKAALNEAKANFKDANLEYKRLKGLHREKVVSASSLDKALATLQASEARVSARKAQILEAEEKLANTIIRAPFSGIVTKRFIETGETMQIGQPIMAGYSNDSLRVSAYVSQNYIEAIRQNQQVHVQKNDGKQITTKKLTIFPIANPKTHTFQVRVLLPNSVEDIYPGMLVKISFKIGNQSRLLIPTTAIVHRREVAAVYVINEKQEIHMRQIREGRQFGDMTEILAGLDENEIISNDPIRAGVTLKRQLEKLK